MPSSNSSQLPSVSEQVYQFALYRTHEGSCFCTRFETYEPLRHSTCLLRLYSFCPKFKIRGKGIYFY